MTPCCSAASAPGRPSPRWPSSRWSPTCATPRRSGSGAACATSARPAAGCPARLGPGQPASSDGWSSASATSCSPRGATARRWSAPDRRRRATVVPNGVDTRLLASRASPRSARDTVVFTGAMDYAAQRRRRAASSSAGMRRSSAPSARRRAARSSGATRRRALARRRRTADGVTVTGAVPDMRPYLSRRRSSPPRCASAPASRTRCSRPWPWRCPVVASPLAADGLRTARGPGAAARPGRRRARRRSPTAIVAALDAAPARPLARPGAQALRGDTLLVAAQRRAGRARASTGRRGRARRRRTGDRPDRASARLGLDRRPRSARTARARRPWPSGSRTSWAARALPLHGGQRRLEQPLLPTTRLARRRQAAPRALRPTRAGPPPPPTRARRGRRRGKRVRTGAALARGWATGWPRSGAARAGLAGDAAGRDGGVRPPLLRRLPRLRHRRRSDLPLSRRIHGFLLARPTRSPTW